MDLGMIVGTYFYDSEYLKEIMKKDKSKDNVNMDKDKNPNQSDLFIETKSSQLSNTRSPFSPSFQPLSGKDKLKEKHKRKQTELKKMKKKHKAKNREKKTTK